MNTINQLHLPGARLLKIYTHREILAVYRVGVRDEIVADPIRILV